MKGFVFKCLMLVCLSAFFCQVSFSFQAAGTNINRINFKGPSGIVFYPASNTLFVVGNDGDICEIKTDGTLVKQRHLRTLDLKGIAYDPATGFLYAAVEGTDKIIQIDPEDFTPCREFYINRDFNGQEVLMAGGNGIEGITFAPDPQHPEGGTFFVTKQSFGLEDREDPSAIFEVEVPIKSNKSNEAEIVRCFYPRVVDLVDISYDYSSGNFYVISDENNVLFEMTREGNILQTYNLPGKDQQGITFDSEGFVYIAQDSGGIIKYKWNKSQGVMDLD